jgi:hypothetical protein
MVVRTRPRRRETTLDVELAHQASDSLPADRDPVAET